MCCISVMNCQPQRSSGERETWYQSRKPLTKGPASCLTASQSSCSFGLCLPSTATNVLCPRLLPHEAVMGRGEALEKDWCFHGGCCSSWLMAPAGPRGALSLPCACPCPCPLSLSHSPPCSCVWDSSSTWLFPLGFTPKQQPVLHITDGQFGS